MLHDQKMAIETHIRELELNVFEPPLAGTYKTICGNCHIRGPELTGIGEMMLVTFLHSSLYPKFRTKSSRCNPNLRGPHAQCVEMVL